jgi:hypothetical protein
MSDRVRRPATGRPSPCRGEVARKHHTTGKRTMPATRTTGWCVCRRCVGLASIPMQPHRRFGYPRPKNPAIPGSVGLLRRGNGPAGGAVGAGEAHRRGLLVNSVRADPATRVFDQFARPSAGSRRSGSTAPPARPGRSPARAAACIGAQCGDRNRPPRPVTPGEVVDLKNLHCVLIALHPAHCALWAGWVCGENQLSATGGDSRLQR